ncbi:MAG: RodZ domain-containing protein [Solidesulfovibrio sp. DCME]|uniref:RodZ domain-containing protein n=1 Tax=Solidesulfovibrio sp. DCME TaxID=3447380 RepID=UPI003D098965
MDLRELGTMLREERERQGLSIEDVSDKIKITRSCLAAIEDGNESVLPHPVYAKGFIKNYARLLGVDQEEFTRRLSEVYRTEETSARDVTLVKDIPDDDCGCPPVRRAPRLPLVPALICAGVVLVVIGLAWYLFTHVFSRSGDTADTATPVQTEPAKPAAETDTPARPVPVVPVQKPQETAPPAVVPQPAPAAPPVAAPTPPATPSAPVATAKQPPVEAKPALSPDDQATQDIAVSGPASPTTPPAIPPAPEPAPAPSQPAAKTFTVGETGPHTVSIVANDRCWLQAGADGGAMHETMLEKGDAFTGRFADYLLVRLGNAGAVEIRFDNKLYPLQATKGSVKTLKFVAKKSEEPAKPAPGQAPAASSSAAPTPGQAPAASAPAPTPAAPVAAVASPAPAPTAGQGGQGAREVELYGQDGSWVIISPDKGPAKEIYVKKGQRLTVPFGEKIEIKLGNPSNVVFRYDGKETAVVTEKGETKSIRFP